MATLKDLARATGVDVSTVSRALAGDVRVAETTRNRIIAAVRDMGYRSHTSARRKQQGRAKPIWFLTGGFNLDLERDTVLHCIDYLAAAGYIGLLAIHRGDVAIEDQVLNQLDRGQADGAIVIPEVLVSARPPNHRLADLVTRRFPVVFLDRHPPTLLAPTVTTDNARAVTELIAAGNAAGVERWVVLRQGGDTVADIRQATAECILAAGSKPWGDAATLPPGFLEKGCVGIFATAAAQLIAWADDQSLPPERLVAMVFDRWPETHPADRQPRQVFIAKQDLPAVAAQAVDLLLEMCRGEPWRPGFHQVPIKPLTVLHRK